MVAFSIPIAKLAEIMKDDVKRVVRKSTLDVASAVVKRTPVDTGRLKNN